MTRAEKEAKEQVKRDHEEARKREEERRKREEELAHREEERQHREEERRHREEEDRRHRQEEMRDVDRKKAEERHLDVEELHPTYRDIETEKHVRQDPYITMGAELEDENYEDLPCHHTFEEEDSIFEREAEEDDEENYGYSHEFTRHATLDHGYNEA